MIWEHGVKMGFTFSIDIHCYNIINSTQSSCNKQTNALNKQTMALKFQKKDENETNVLMPVYINAAMAPMNPVPMTERT